MKRNVLALALALVTIPAQAEVVAIQWNADGAFAHAGTVPGRGFLEICGKIPAGLTIDWSFASAAPLESNVHFHEGKQVNYPARHQPAAAVTDRLIVATEQEYCWMWTNRTQQSVPMTMQLKKSM